MAIGQRLLRNEVSPVMRCADNWSIKVTHI
jgi:hypothetical protein